MSIIFNGVKITENLHSSAFFNEGQLDNVYFNGNLVWWKRVQGSWSGSTLSSDGSISSGIETSGAQHRAYNGATSVQGEWITSTYEMTNSFSGYSVYTGGFRGTRIISNMLYDESNSAYDGSGTVIDRSATAITYDPATNNFTGSNDKYSTSGGMMRIDATSGASAGDYISYR